MMIILLMGRDYVSELRSPTGQLFIPQEICEHAELRWKDIDRGKLLIRPAESLAAKQDVLAKKTMNLSYEFSLTKYLCSHFERIFDMP
jgi:hypothetical protein